MKLKVEIDIGNDAYTGANLGHELAKNLRDLATKLVVLEQADAKKAVGETLAHVHDSNGNKVGRAYFTR